MTTSDAEKTPLFVSEARTQLNEAILRIRHCLDQLEETQLWWRPQPGQNSIANLVLHVRGNLRQRIVSVVGGASDTRQREGEFAERGPLTREELLRQLDDVAEQADRTLAGLTPVDLEQRRQYPGATRRFDETMMGAILRTLMHLGGHAQEIICLTRQQLGDGYQFLGAPPASRPDSSS